MWHHAACHCSTVAFSSIIVLPQRRRVVASLDLQGSSLFACSLGWRVPCSLSLMCVPLPAWTFPVPCCVPSATQCSVTTHVATENVWVSKPGVWEGVEREASVPLPLPTLQTHQEASLTCRLRTSPNNTVVGREQESLESPFQTGSSPTLTPAIWEPFLARPRAPVPSALLLAPATSPCPCRYGPHTTSKWQGGSCPFRTTSHPLP